MVLFLYLICFLWLFVLIPQALSDELKEISHIQDRIEEIKGRIEGFEADIEKRRGDAPDEAMGKKGSKDDPREDKEVLKKKIKDLEEKIEGFREEEEEREAREEESRFKGFYLNLGWSYVMENFDEGSLNTVEGPFGFEPEYSGGSSVFGINFRTETQQLRNMYDILRINAAVGYKFNGRRSIELCFDYLPCFYWKGEEKYSNLLEATQGAYWRLYAKVNIITIMAAVKYSPFSISDNIKPFFVVGTGVMYGRIEKQDYLPNPDLDVSYFGFELFEPLMGYETGLWGYRGYDSMTGLCSKFGVGADVFINDHFSIGIETTYIFGEGDLDKIKYMKATAGITYHF